LNIGILGAGNIGSTTARLFAAAGHSVAISHSKGPESLEALVSSLGPRVRALSTEDAVKFGEVVLLAVPWGKRAELPPAQLFENKIVIDAMNPFGPNGPIDLGNTTSSEEISKQLPGARLVKAFNTLNFQILGTGSRPANQDRLVLFMAGDDTEAKEVVARLIEDVGFATVDTGFLREGGRLQQPGSPIFNVPMTVQEAKQRLSNL
jgi:predicted dinucleotide-binding enzyme